MEDDEEQSDNQNHGQTDNKSYAEPQHQRMFARSFSEQKMDHLLSSSEIQTLKPDFSGNSKHYLLWYIIVNFEFIYF